MSAQGYSMENTKDNTEASQSLENKHQHRLETKSYYLTISSFSLEEVDFCFPLYAFTWVLWLHFKHIHY